MFPFTHMTPTELAQAARDSGPLGGVLADRIDELTDEKEWAEQQSKEADEKRDETERELETANEKMNTLSDTLFDELESLLSVIPEKTTHKGLIVIRERLEAMKNTILESAK